MGEASMGFFYIFNGNNNDDNNNNDNNNVLFFEGWGHFFISLNVYIRRLFFCDYVFLKYNRYKTGEKK